MDWEPPAGRPSSPLDPPPPELSRPGTQPPPPMAPPPAPPKRRRWPWVLGGLVVLLVLAIGGCSYLVFRAARPSVDAANEWLALVDEQRFGQAYDALCPQLRAEVARAAGEAELQGDFGAGIDAYRLSSFQSTNGVVTVGGNVTVGGVEQPITLRMDDSTGEWLVCGYGFEPLVLD